jgi:hypothetical protein
MGAALAAQRLFKRLDPQPLAIEIRHLGCPASAQ